MSSSHRSPSRAQVKAAVLALLHKTPAGLSRGQIAERMSRGSVPTLRRALQELRSDAVVEWDPSAGVWRLVDEDYGVPLDVPTPEDRDAVLIAEAMLAPYADRDLRARLRRLGEQLDDRIGGDRSGRDGGRPATSAVTATLTLGTGVDRTVLMRLIRACQREVVQFTYARPWTREGSRVRVVEPWQVRLHDGAGYLRGWDQRRSEPRTFRLAHIAGLSSIPAARPRTPVPRPAELWEHGDPAFGIDLDRPDVAVLRFRGPVARWLGPIRWHERQRDRWLEDGQVLERTLPYRSCRELARRLLGFLDGIDGPMGIEPIALREQVRAMIEQYELKHGA